MSSIIGSASRRLTDVNKGEETAESTANIRSESPDVVAKTIIDESLDAALLQQIPGVFGGVDVFLAKESDLDVGVAVDIYSVFTSEAL